MPFVVEKVRKLNQIHAKLDWQLSRNESVFQEAIQRWFAFNTKQIQTDLRTKFQKDITSELTDWEWLQEQGQDILRPASLKIMQTGGQQAYNALQAEASFSVLNPEAVKAAEKFTASMVKEVNSETKKGIRTYISAGIKEGKSMDKIARELRPLVGLTKNQTQSVINYKALLSDTDKFPGLSASDIDKKVQRYADKTHIRRAKTIARTEAARAQNIGYATGMEELGVDRLEFSATMDDRTSATCEELDGKKYSIGEAKSLIPVHPNCRCAMLPVIGKTSVCRFTKGIEKAACIPPNDLGNAQIDSLLNQLKRSKDPAERRKIRSALRKLGHKGGLKKPTPSKVPQEVPTSVPAGAEKPTYPDWGTSSRWTGARKKGTMTGEERLTALAREGGKYPNDPSIDVTVNLRGKTVRTPAWKLWQKITAQNKKTGLAKPTPFPSGELTQDQVFKYASAKQRYAVYQWQSEEFISVEMTKIQRGLKPVTTWRGKQAQYYLTHLEDLVKHMPNYKGTTYRGMTLDKAQAAKMFSKGKTWTAESFSSTSPKLSIARQFATTEATDPNRVGIVIKSTQKTGAELGKFRDYLHHAENEILVRKGTKFKIDKAVLKYDKKLGGKYWEVSMSEL